MAELTGAQRAYLETQRLGRMATADPEGQPQANPVGFFLQDDGTVLVGGRNMGASKKWRNLQSNPKVSIVIDDVVSVSPWEVRAVEIRGTAELLVGGHPLAESFGPEAVRIHPRKILSWGLEDTEA
ncbi:PPOX class F420-dependent oxidoreductase [Nocardiopsis halophila]|uniref:PPOX class F420-dependent oxidoreductase n=1 Tax=Nocardiopsis halophila TaxID=141692 RepID=UPI0003470EB4|nr:PPOX class F420-dependent oxidoreductase [Nocardiopsis halophila]